MEIGPEGASPPSLSVVIPTLNEASCLAGCVALARERVSPGEPPPEILVADCGSTDGTPDIAKRLGTILVTADPPLASRAAALNAGAREARAGVLLFLHADSEVPPGYDAEIRRLLARPRVVGGAFEFRLDGRHPGLRVVELVNRTRYRIWKRYYGDQGIFCTRTAFDRVGGFPDQPILEDSEFCRRLGRTGRLALSRRAMVTSSRRFIEGGVARVFARDVRIWWSELRGRPTACFAEDYRRDNLSRAERSTSRTTQTSSRESIRSMDQDEGRSYT